MNLIAARALAMYLIPGCVETGVRLGSESSSGAAGATGGGGVWKSGDLEIWEFGDLGFWRSGDLEIQKFGINRMEKINVLKIQIRSVQNVGKVWISRKKILLAQFGAIWAHFLRGPKNKKMSRFCLCSLVCQMTGCAL